MATIVCIHTKFRCQANLEPHLCMKFATKFSISPKIAVSRGNLWGAEKNFPTGGAGCLGEGWENFAVQGGAEPLGGGSKI